MKKIFTKEWWAAAGIRALKTFAQTLLGFISVTGIAFGDVDWITALSVSGVAAVASICTSIVGLPELKSDETEAE